MIRYYAYYNCGGYKDMYIGTDSMNVDATYFVPLLPVWRNRNKPEDSEKIAKAEAVTHVELITNTKPCDFPNECNVLFSHAGYKAIYMTLQDGTACFCIRDIDEHNRDEENRRIPFNFLFIAEGDYSIKKLDSLALSYLSDSDGVEDIIRKSISFAPIINGIKFSLYNLERLFSGSENLGIRHVAGRVAYLKTYNIQLALSELGINANNIDVFYDDKNNIIEGELLSYSYKKAPADTEEPETVPTDDIKRPLENEQPACVELEDNTSESEYKVIDVSVEQPNVSPLGNIPDVTPILDMDKNNTYLKEIMNNVSDTSKDVIALKEQIYALSKVVDENFSHLEALINEIKDSSEGNLRLVNIISGKFLSKQSFKKMIKYLLVLMLGVILGIILF